MFRIKKVLSGVLAVVMAFSFSIPSFAYTPSTYSSQMLNVTIDEKTANKIVRELLQEEYEYENDDPVQTRGVVTKSVKIALKFLKKNLPKVNKILKKYGVKVVKGKGMMAVIDNILAGVIEVDEGVDNVIYYIVDVSFPSWNANVKKVVANGIRLMLPV